MPPLILVLPPLIWGWLTYRVMAFDALAEHASREERRESFAGTGRWLLGIGVLTGYLGAAPSIVWASGALVRGGFRDPGPLRSGSTRWCSPSPRSGSRTIASLRWSGSAPRPPRRGAAAATHGPDAPLALADDAGIPASLSRAP